MPNSQRRTEQTLVAKGPGDTPPMASAVVLLRQALGGHASVDWERAPHSQDGVNLTVSFGQQRHTLQLVPRPKAVRGNSAPSVLVLSRATKDLRAAMRARGQQFIDLSGAVHLRLPWAIIDRSDLDPIRPSSPLSSTTDPFADRGSLVLRVMLEHDPTRIWSVRELARAADVGPATASGVLRALHNRKLIRVVRSGRAAEVTLGSPNALVEEWTRAYDWRLNRGITVEAPVGDLKRFVMSLPERFRRATRTGAPRWALTLHAGASFISPHATWDRIHIYVDVQPKAREQALLSLAAQVGWTPSESGKIVLMSPYYTVSAWHGLREIDGVPLVSDLQLALDLWHYPLRGREQAQHLLARMFTRGAP